MGWIYILKTHRSTPVSTLSDVPSEGGNALPVGQVYVRGGGGGRAPRGAPLGTRERRTVGRENTRGCCAARVRRVILQKPKKERRKKDERRKNNPLACLNTIERHIERLVLPEKNHKDIIVHVSKTGMHTTTSSHVLGVRGVRRPCRRFCFGFFGVRRPSRAGNAKTVSARAGRPKPTTSPPSFRVPKSPTFSLIYVS
jgi:hypothetical protein